MAQTKATAKEVEADVRPNYYEVYGTEIANGNRAWVIAFISLSLTVIAIIFAVFVRLQPPTVIRIGANGEATVLGRGAKGPDISAATAGTDTLLNEAFVKRFLTTYLNYMPSDVDERWASSLNMMTRNLRGYTLKAMADDNTRGKVDDDQVQSVFHLRAVDTIPGEPLTFLAYGVKDVHHLTKGTETTDHFVSEYRIRLLADRRTNMNPDGLWVAEYSERPIDDERRGRILAMQDTTQPQE